MRLHTQRHTEEGAGMEETCVLQVLLRVPYMCFGSGGSLAVSVWIQDITCERTK